MASFNKGPSYGLSAEVKNKVGVLYSHIFYLKYQLKFSTFSHHCAFLGSRVWESPGLHFDMSVQVIR